MAETKKAAKPAYALVLDFPGAPATPHVVAGLEGEYSLEPRPLDECTFAATPEHGVRPVTLEDARALDADDGCPLKLVNLKE